MRNVDVYNANHSLKIPTHFKKMYFTHFIVTDSRANLSLDHHFQKTRKLKPEHNYIEKKYIDIMQRRF